MTPSRPLAVIGAAATLIAGTAMGAAAITGGQRDGDQHPNVALITFYAGGRLSMCTATLVSPTVLLTAGHCTAGVSGRVGATFESVIAEQPAPDGSPRCRSHPGRPGTPTRSSPRPATSPAPPTPTRATRPSPIPATGTTSASSSSTSRSTTSPPRARGWGLSRPVPAEHPQRDRVHRRGYGTEVRAAESGLQNPTPQPYPLVRRLADAPGQKLTDQILQVNSNEKDPRGTGGTCFGDSGAGLPRRPPSRSRFTATPRTAATSPASAWTSRSCRTGSPRSSASRQPADRLGCPDGCPADPHLHARLMFRASSAPEPTADMASPRAGSSSSEPPAATSTISTRSSATATTTSWWPSPPRRSRTSPGVPTRRPRRFEVPAGHPDRGESGLP